jgi:hypothetical protein
VSQFATALFRHPNRARAVLGAARAAARRDHRVDALRAYRQCLQQWQQADAPLAELHEVHTYLQQAREIVTAPGIGER